MSQPSVLIGTLLLDYITGEQEQIRGVLQSDYGKLARIIQSTQEGMQSAAQSQLLVDRVFGEDSGIVVPRSHSELDWLLTTHRIMPSWTAPLRLPRAYAYNVVVIRQQEIVSHRLVRIRRAIMLIG